MQNTDAILDVFNFSVEDITTPETNNRSQIYTPDPKKGKAGVYDSVIRFLPWYQNVAESVIKKSFFWLEDPHTKTGFYADCPTNVGEKSLLWNLYWDFKKSESITEQAKAEKFKRKENYYSLIQIVKDENRPELQGKIMIFKYGYKLHQMIESAKKPKFGEPVNPFDLFNAPLFGLSVKIVHGWNNYDDSKFIPKTEGPININGKMMTTSAEDKATIMEYLKTSPDLAANKHQPWDQEKTDKVMAIVRFYTNTANTVIPTAAAQAGPQMQAQTQPVTNVASTPVNSTPVSTPVSQPTENAATVTTPVQQTQAVVTEAPASDDPLAALYANL